MKFLCDRCKTRYSIGDDRVRGKILKIRCKNCANVITVREGMTDEGGVDAPDGARPRAMTAAAPVVQIPAPAPANGRGALGAAFASAMSKPPPALEEEWYVSLDGDQEGPYSLADAQRWVAARAFDAELHCWSEGFDDWLPVDKVSHFRGLRKKPVVASPPPMPRSGPQPGRLAAAPSAASAPMEEEPKPLFAATMASLEKSAPESRGGLVLPRVTEQKITARATPPGGVPATNGTGASGALKASNATSGPAARVAARAGAGPKIPGFDLDADSSDSATQIGAPPFEDEVSTTAEPVASAKRAGPAPASPFGPFFPAGAGPVDQRTPGPVGITAPKQGRPVARLPEADVDDEGDLDIGEVSRVVNLADLAKGGALRPATRAGPVGREPGSVGPLGGIGRTTGSVANLGKTGSVARIDMATGLPIAPLAPGIDPATLSPLDPHYVPDAALAPPVTPTAQQHRRMYIALAVGALLLIGIVVSVVVVVNHDDTGTQIGSLRNGPDYSTERPEDRLRSGSNLAPNPTGSATTAPQNPFLRPTQVKPKITTYVPPVVEIAKDQLSVDEIEAKAKQNEGLTLRCFMRAGKGANAITVGDVKKLIVTLGIAKEGNVTSVGLSGGHQTDALGACLVPAIKSWRFRPNGGGTFRITVAAPGN